MFAMLLGLLGFVVFQWRFLKVSEKDKPQPIGQERTGAPSQPSIRSGRQMK